MELFTVKRYNEDAPPDNPEKEDEILNKLLKKAEKRKSKLEKISETTCDNAAKSSTPENTDKIYGNEAKKVKSDDLISSESPEEEIDTEENQKLGAEDFKVLGDDVFTKKKRVDMVLPPWLAHPTIIATKLSDELVEGRIEDLPYISEEMKENLQEMKIDKLFPVQREVIPWLLDAHSKPTPFRPRDICVSAPTGSGKTLAFAVPIIELLSKRVERKIRALVVLPVSELALQVFKVFKTLARNTSLSVCLMSKSIPLAVEQNKLVDIFKGKYHSKVDIIITTPGRLVEHLHATKGFCLKSLKFLVIDEADKIMEQIHHNWLYHLDTHVKNTSDMILSGRSAGLCINDLEGDAQLQPHKLLFSATLSQDPEKLQNLKLFQPKLFTSVITSVTELTKKFIEEAQGNKENDVRGEFVGKYTTPDELTEKYCITEARLKPLTLYSLIRENKWKKFLCFTNSSMGAHRLAFILGFLHCNHLTIAELSASLSPKARSLILRKFAVGKINGLVCSDALARGIDIPEVDVVISYDAPRHIKTHIHRIGRTARAGRPGTAVTLLNTKEFTKFNNILAEAGKEATNEIKVKGNIEEDNAKRYSLALKNLEKSLASEKYLKKSRKKQAKEKAVKLPSEMTTIEKLQVEVSDVLESKYNTEAKKYKRN